MITLMTTLGEQWKSLTVEQGGDEDDNGAGVHHFSQSGERLPQLIRGVVNHLYQRRVVVLLPVDRPFVVTLDT